MKPKTYIITGVISVILLLLLTLMYVWNYGFHFPPCLSHEEPISVPILMETADIIFEKPKYYVIPPGEKIEPSRWKECIDMRREDNGKILDEDNDYFLRDAGYQVLPIPEGTRFKLVRAGYTYNHGINGLAPDWGEMYLLQDDKGKKWTIRPLYFQNLKSPYEPKWAAGYYDGDKRIGDVVMGRE